MVEEAIPTNLALAQEAATTLDPHRQKELSTHPSAIVVERLLTNPNLAEEIRQAIQRAIANSLTASGKE